MLNTDALRGTYGTYHITKTGETTINFCSFIPEEETIIDHIYSSGRDIISSITDDATEPFAAGVVVTPPDGIPFEKINIVSGKITVYIAR